VAVSVFSRPALAAKRRVRWAARSEDSVAKLEVARVIIFAKDMLKMESFYGNVIGLPRVQTPDDSPDFISFEAGAVHLALHRIPDELARTLEIADPPVAREGTPIKIAFHAGNVHRSRAELNSRGANLGRIRDFGALYLCDGTDPEGNIFQLSNR
jgi:predicted enzyme related to lactoylglutathione lyase